MKIFGHVRHDRDEKGQVIGSKSSPVKARTIEGLGTAYGPDSLKRLVCSLEAGDLITLRPEKTQRKLAIKATDLYAQLVRQHAERERLEKRRARKGKL